MIEGRWWHWNHEYIPPWDKNDHHVYPTGAHNPPLDIGANFYPSIGAYRCGNYLKQSANGNQLPFIFCCSAQEIHWCWRNIWQWPPRLGPAYLQCLGTVSSHIRPRCLIVHLLLICWSRYPPGQADEHGPPSDGIIPLLLERALPHKVTICIHVEPYEGRSAESLHKHLNYVHQTYGSHPAYHKTRRGSRNLPVFYIYDSYRYVRCSWILQPHFDEALQ